MTFQSCFLRPVPGNFHRSPWARWSGRARHAVAAGCSLALVLTSGCASTSESAAAANPTQPVMARPIKPELARATFEAVWTTINEQHFDASHNGANWAAIGDEFRPKVEGVTTESELRGLLETMLARLDQSHFGIIPREVAGHDALAPSDTNQDQAQHAHHEHAGHHHEPEPTHVDHRERNGGSGDLGIWFRIVDGRVTTVAPRPGGAADRAGLGAGEVVIAIDDQPLGFAIPPASDITRPGGCMRRFHAELNAASCAAVNAGERVDITVRGSGGTPTTYTLEATSAEGELAQFGNLPPMQVTVDARPIGTDEFDRAGVPAEKRLGTVGYIAFNIWMLPAAAPLDAAIDRFRSADAIILDLRGNPGGIGAMAMGIGGHFLNEAKSLGRMTNREGYIDFRVNPRRATADGRRVEPFAGPLVILVDPLSASTSEIFAGGLQELGRATIVGQRTAGAALPSVVVRLPNRDVLQFAIADFLTPKGNRIEGHGVVPDVEVTLSTDLLKREGDPVLAAALRWLAERSTTGSNAG